MKQIRKFKKIFANFFIFLFLIFPHSGLFVTSVSAQTFPLSASVDTSKINTLRVKVANNTALAYTTRLLVTDQTDLSHSFATKPDKVIPSGSTEIFTYQPTLHNHQYVIKVLVTTEMNPTSTAQFQEKILSAIGTGTEATTPATDTPQKADTDIDYAAQGGTPQQCAAAGPGPNSCSDDRDNDGDCRADWDGAIIGGVAYPPDPACISAKSTEFADDVESTIIPCTNKCDLGSVMQFLNNMIAFVIKTILLPLIIVMFVYAGYTYITAQGNPGKKANVKKMIGHIVLGIVIMLCAWVIIKTVLVVLGYADSLFFFE